MCWFVVFVLATVCAVNTDRIGGGGARTVHVDEVDGLCR